MMSTRQSGLSSPTRSVSHNAASCPDCYPSESCPSLFVRDRVIRFITLLLNAEAALHPPHTHSAVKQQHTVLFHRPMCWERAHVGPFLTSTLTRPKQICCDPVDAHTCVSSRTVGRSVTRRQHWECAGAYASSPTTCTACHLPSAHASLPSLQPPLDDTQGELPQLCTERTHQLNSQAAGSL